MERTTKKIITKNNGKKEEKVMMMKKFFSRGNRRRLAAVVMAFAITISGVSVTPQTAEAAKYDYTYTSISGRSVDITDGVVTLSVDGATYQLSLKRSVTVTAADQYGTVWMRYKNNALYFASYEIEGKDVIKHRLMMDGTAAYAEKLLFKGLNPLVATHYVDNNGKEVELPNLDYLRKQLGKEIPTVTPSVQPSATATVTPSVQPSATATVTPSVQPSATASVTPSVQPSATVTVKPSTTPNVVIDSTTTETSKTETNTEIDAKFWINKYEKGEITWEQMTEALKICTEVARTEYDEVTRTEYIYDKDDKLIETIEKKSGSKEEVVNKTETSATTNSGTADTKKEEEIQGGATVKKDETSTTNKESNTHIEVNDKRPSTTKGTTTKKVGKPYVRYSGSKMQWITAKGSTKATAFNKKGKFKYNTIKGKKVVAMGFIKKTEVLICRLKGGVTYLIDMKTQKMVKLKEKTIRFYRSKVGGNFVNNVVLKNGKKVNAEKWKVKKGQYGFNLNKVRRIRSYKKC